jgi:hypothetical protein
MSVGAECHYNTDCAAANYCQSGPGVITVWPAHGYCAARQAAGASCASDRECADGLTCLEEVCRAQGSKLPSQAICTQNSDCRSGECVAPAGGCVQADYCPHLCA